MCLLKGASTFAMVAGWAGCHQVVPGMFSTLAAWNDVIDRQVEGGFSAVLAGVIIPAQDLTFIQLDADAGSLDHAFQADD